MKIAFRFHFSTNFLIVDPKQPLILGMSIDFAENIPYIYRVLSEGIWENPCKHFGCS